MGLSIHENLLSYYEKIENTLNKCGFHKEESISSDFKSAYTKRNLFTSLVFLIKIVDYRNFDELVINNLISSGRWVQKEENQEKDAR